ncbi:hypothetical protein OAM56_01860 [Alphaproteobacteria bacterium]|nr:hypothetical protein [Alphaproteobacteria bacterium]
MKRKNNIAILIISCDSFSDLWKPSLKNLKSYKKLSDTKTYLIGNRKKINFPGVTQILVGPDSFWTSNLKKALLSISEDYLFVLVDDFYLINLDKNFMLDDIATLMKKNNFFHLKFHNVPKAKNITNETNIYSYDLAEPYCVSVCGFWKKSVLQDLCHNPESAWEFEINASFRSSVYGATCSYLKAPFECLNLIEKGKWSRKINKNFLIQNQFEINERKFGNFFSNIVSFLKETLFHIILKINWKKRLKIINTLRKIFVVY